MRSPLEKMKEAFGRYDYQNIVGHESEKHTEIKDLRKKLDTNHFSDPSDKTSRMCKRENGRDPVDNTSDDAHGQECLALKTRDGKGLNRKTPASVDSRFVNQLIPYLMRLVHWQRVDFFFWVIKKYLIKVRLDDRLQVPIGIVRLQLFLYLLCLQKVIFMYLALRFFFVRARYRLSSPRLIGEISTCLVPFSTCKNIPMYNIIMNETSKFSSFGGTRVMLDVLNKQMNLEASWKKFAPFDNRLFKKVFYTI